MSTRSGGRSTRSSAVMRSCGPRSRSEGGVPLPDHRRGRVRSPLPIIDLTATPEADREAEARRRIDAEASRPFDLARGPMLRAGLIKLSEEDHIILVTMHHIASDGWSIGVLIREVAGAL